MNIRYRHFDIHNEDRNKWFELYKATYKEDIDTLKWEWKYIKNPLSKKIKIYVAEDNDRIIGATTRLPYYFSIKDRKQIIYFNIDSMVHPEYRRLGIINKLYELASKELPVTYSKGTVPAMYRVLMEMGFKQLHPNTFMVCVLSWPKWVLTKFNLIKSNNFNGKNIKLKNFEFIEISKFGPEFDIFWDKVEKQYKGIVIKNSQYMNWRYFDIPDKKYKAFYRKENDQITSAIVLTQKEGAAKIVDIVYDQANKDEPSQTILFAKKYLKKSGVVKVHCWSSNLDFRKELKKHLFFDRGETPNFSIFALKEQLDLYSDVGSYSFCEGDGDSEFG